MKLSIRTLVSTTLVFSSLAFANLSDAQKFNAIALEILAPLNNKLTKISVNASEIAFESDKLAELDLDVTFAKSGKVNIFDFLANVDFSSDDEQTTAEVFGQGQLNLPVAFGQQTLNDYAPLLADYAKNLVADATKQYGDNIKIDARVFDEVYDDKKDVVSLKFEANVEIDLDKLDPKLKADTFLKTGGALLLISREGFEFELQIEFNPDYSFFKSENKMLKDYFADILEKDEETLSQFYSFFESFDRAITNIVDNKFEEQE